MEPGNENCHRIGTTVPGCGRTVPFRKLPYALLARLGLYFAVFSPTETPLNHLYDPNRLLSALCQHLGITTDKKLAKTLGFSAGIIAGLRAGRIAITATMYLQMHEITGLPLPALQALSGDRRQRLRVSGLARSDISRALEH